MPAGAEEDKQEDPSHEKLQPLQGCAEQGAQMRILQYTSGMARGWDCALSRLR